jgi:ferritin-like metal-binding protein YciE
MFEHFDNPQELFEYRLGSALTMEHDSLDMLRELETAAQSEEIKHLFAHHAQETQQQIANLEKCFSTLGVDVNDSPSPTTKGLAKEGSSLVSKTDPALLDTVVLAAALGTEHYEISAYQTLVTSAEAMGAREVVALLKENLQHEEHTSEELNAAAKKVAATV